MNKTLEAEYCEQTGKLSIIGPTGEWTIVSFTGEPEFDLYITGRHADEYHSSWDSFKSAYTRAQQL